MWEPASSGASRGLPNEGARTSGGQHERSEEEKELEASIRATFKVRECLLTIINVCEGKAGPETVPVRRKKDLENTQFVLGLCSACGTILQELSTDLVQAEEKRDLPGATGSCAGGAL